MTSLPGGVGVVGGETVEPDTLVVSASRLSYFIFKKKQYVFLQGEKRILTAEMS